MANASPVKSLRDGDWSRAITIPDSPWYSSTQSVNNAVPDGAAEDDLGYQVSLYHAVRLDMDATIGGAFPSAPWSPPTFSASAGSTVTRLPSGVYRVGYQIQNANGTSSGGNSETAQVAITEGVSKPRVTFPGAPPAGMYYELYMTDNSGLSGTENSYCSGITGDYVDLVTELWYTQYPLLADPPIVETVPGWPSVAGSHALNPHATPGAIFTALFVTNALTIFPGGSLTVASGFTLTLAGDLWLATTTTSPGGFLLLEEDARIAFDNSQSPVPAWSDYQVWSASGRLRIGGA